MQQATQRLLQTMDGPEDRKIADFLEGKRRREQQQLQISKDRSSNDESSVEKTNDTNKVKLVGPQRK